MIRPSCSVIEQKVQPPKQPRMILTEKRIISYAGIFLSPYDLWGTRLYGKSNTPSISGVVNGIGGGFNHTSRSPCCCTKAKALPGLVSR